MEQNTIKHNGIAFQLHMKHLALFLAFIFGLSAAYALVTEKPTPEPTFPVNQPTGYEVIATTFDTKNSGKAVVKLDGFYIYTSFDFSSQKDGATGKPYAEVTNLAIDHITSINGHEYNDFTVNEDHRNIVSVIAAHIENNNLAGGV